MELDNTEQMSFFDLFLLYIILFHLESIDIPTNINVENQQANKAVQKYDGHCYESKKNDKPRV